MLYLIYTVKLLNFLFFSFSITVELMTKSIDDINSLNTIKLPRFKSKRCFPLGQ